MSLIDQIRRKRPKMAARADTSRAAAIRLHCLECMGDNAAEVRRCSRLACPLHPFRLGRAEPAGAGMDKMNVYRAEPRFEGGES